MHQMFMCKQFFGFLTALSNISQETRHKHLGQLCPSCHTTVETTGDKLHCTEKGQVLTLPWYAVRILGWLTSVQKFPQATFLLIKYVQHQGCITLIHIGHTVHSVYWPFMTSQDKIGWQKFMEGIISKELQFIPLEFYSWNLLLLTSWTDAKVSSCILLRLPQWAMDIPKSGNAW